jgi:hypothetical protein
MCCQHSLVVGVLLDLTDHGHTFERGIQDRENVQELRCVDDQVAHSTTSTAEQALVLVIDLEWILLLVLHRLLLLSGKRTSILVAVAACDIQTLVQQSLSLLIVVELLPLLRGKQSILAIELKVEHPWQVGVLREGVNWTHALIEEDVHILNIS